VATNRRFAAFLAERLGDTDSRDQIVELGFSLRVCTVEGRGRRARWLTDDEARARGVDVEEEILRVGGRWDRVRREWVGDAAEVPVLRITRGGGQELAARWLARWFHAHVGGDWQGAGLTRWDEATQQEVRSVWSVLLSGGRRSGKSHLACVALALFAVLYPEAIVWAISPTQDETAELETALRRMVPSAWYRYRGAGAGKVSTFTLLHGAKILLVSGHKPRSLRRGRVDLVLYNEAQNMSKAGYVQLRPAIADTGGLVLIAANPPTEAIGRWVEDHQEGISNRKIDGVEFEFNPETNPWVEITALHSMQAEVDEVTYDRDVLGLFRPIGNVVFHAWSDRESRRDVEGEIEDVTTQVTRQHLGRAFDWMVGMDFQAQPAMTAAILKFFRARSQPDDLLTWVVGEVVAVEANEDDLVDALAVADRWTPTGYQLGAGFRPEECGVVMDASAWWQDGAHSTGKTSDLKLRARGWVHLYRPQKDSNRNPDILERVKAGNARLKTKDGKRHMFVTPQCKHVARALKLWENRHGIPHRKSEHAHLCDSVTYPVYRVFGRPPPPRGDSGYVGVGRHTRAAELREHGDED
jgi:hypothetical protein